MEGAPPGPPCASDIFSNAIALWLLNFKIWPETRDEKTDMHKK